MKAMAAAGALVLAALSLPAAARASSPTTQTSSAAQLRRAEATIAGARSQLTPGSLAAGVRAAAAMADVGLGPTSILPPAPAPAPTGVPNTLATPVARLLAAIATTKAAVARAIPNDPRVEQTQEEHIHLAELLVRATASQPDRAAQAELDRQRHEVESLVDEDALYAAALGLAEAIDAAVPELLANPPAAPRDAEALGCDVVDQPQLCIGGAGANTYTSDRALVIDLGGDDVHTHTAGGASTALPVAVTIDLGGNDRYERTDGIAQGTGNLGIGILLDADGDDRYSIAATKGTESAAGQGTNFSAGVGILSDRAGRDTYTLTSTRSDSAFAAGQGRGAQPGFGLLLDDGAGNDLYLASVRPATILETKSDVKFGGLNVNGMGLGAAGGVGIMSDGGGTDSVTMEAVTPTIAADEPRPVAQTPVFGTLGMGAAATGGAGLMLSKAGATTRTATSTNIGPRTGIIASSVFGIGSAGVGALIDEGGDDTYTAVATSEAAQHVRVTDACACNGGRAEPKLAIPGVAALSLRAMGSGLLGVGILRDLGGDDTYRAAASVVADATVTDERTRPGPDGTFGHSDAIATVNAVALGVQGAGSGGVGVLEDTAGNDLYRATNDATAHAEATAIYQDTDLEGRAAADQVMTDAQAAGSGTNPGLGVLRDGGGKDRYEVSSRQHVSATPETKITTKPITSSAQASSQGNAVALLHDRDTAAPDVFTLTPADPTCDGARGQGTWRDCGDGAGVGVVDDAG